MPMEFFKEMSESTLETTRTIINVWWRQEYVPNDILEARVVLTYKQGNASDLRNYRPISLRNSLYKIFAAIIHDRIEDKLDKHLQRNTIRIPQKKEAPQTR